MGPCFITSETSGEHHRRLSAKDTTKVFQRVEPSRTRTGDGNPNGDPHESGKPYVSDSHGYNTRAFLETTHYKAGEEIQLFCNRRNPTFSP